MILICDKCGQKREQQFGIKISDQKICVKCLAKIIIDRMPMPYMTNANIPLQARVEKLEQKMKGILNDKSNDVNGAGKARKDHRNTK
jgi:hypothetical protein